jgi:hypothetical protein
VPGVVPLATDIVPFGFNVNPVGTVTAVNTTWLGDNGLPFTVSLLSIDGVGLPGVTVTVSGVASAVGSTVTVTVAVSQTVELLT